MKYIKDWINKNVKKNRTKNYIHFDVPIDFSSKIMLSREDKRKLPQNFFEDFFNEEKVAKRGFWPLIHFTKKERRVKIINNKIQKSLKPREIYYASHFDSYIYSYYGYMLSIEYEKKLQIQNLENNILAYRSIKGENSIGKNNIDFALDVFNDIKYQQNCMVFTFDIKGFFDSLDWNILTKELLLLLKVEDLPNDWKNIIKSVTEFSYIEQIDIEKYKLIDNKNHKRIISQEKFKKAKKDYKKDTGENLVRKNKNTYGIAQGTPLSGLLANVYMNKFDVEIKKFTENLGGKFYRYSDDILIIIPKIKDPQKIISEITQYIFAEIKKLKLEIQPQKTEIFLFKENKLQESYSFQEDIGNFENHKNIKRLEYLGFSFDGERVLLKNKTLTRYYGRMKRGIKRLACLNKKLVKKGKVIKDNRKIKDEILLGEINKRFTYQAKNKKQQYGNFLNYVRQAQNRMKEINKGNFIQKQVKNNNKTFQKIKKNYLNNK